MNFADESRERVIMVVVVRLVEQDVRKRGNEVLGAEGVHDRGVQRDHKLVDDGQRCRVPGGRHTNGGNGS